MGDLASRQYDFVGTIVETPLPPAPGTPVNPNDFVTKGYTDALIAALLAGNNTWLGNNTLQGKLFGKVQVDSTSGSNQTLPEPTNLIMRSSAVTSIAGITRTNSPQFLIWVNGTGNPVNVLNNSALATAGHRIITGTGGDLNVGVDSSLWLVGDTVSDRWRIVGGSGASGAGGFKPTDVTGNYTVLTADQLIRSNPGSNSTIWLPPWALGLVIKVKRNWNSNESFTLSVVPNGSDTIEGSSSYGMNFSGQAATFVATSSGLWEVFS